MRVIRFRAKAAMTCHRIGRDKPLYEKGDWVYGWLFKSVHSYEKREMDSYVIQTEIDGEVMSVDVVEETIGQFTGLHDIDGTHIYEGDIIQGEYKYQHLVRYNEQEAHFTATELRYVGDRIFDTNSSSVYQKWIDEFKKKVVGNMYDNKDLLERATEWQRE